MIIFFDTETREIVGVSMISADSSGKVNEPTLSSSFPGNPPPDVGYFFTPNDAAIANELSSYRIVWGSRGRPESIERKPPRPIITISTDAADRDGNGIPEIVANGRSQCNITASVRDEGGGLITNFRKPITFKTTGGVLFQKEVRCKSGVAKTILRSVEETLTPTITATAPGCTPGTIEIEFILETTFS